MRWEWLLLLVAVLAPAWGFMVLVPDTTPVGHKIFLANLDGPTRYKLDSRWTASYVHRLLHVDHTTGAVVVKRPLDCAGTFYTNPITLWLEAWSERPGAPLDYASVPLRVVVTGEACRHHAALLEREVTSWIDTVALSLPLPDPDPSDPDRLCLRRSQVILRIPSLLPRTMQACKLVYNTVSDHRLTVETHGGDLVSLIDTCLTGITKVKLGLRLRCPGVAEPYNHDMSLVLHNAINTNERHIRRIRRQMQTAAPYFERNLEVAHVIEESEKGTTVTTVTATDPVNSPLTYSIEALLDDRSQRMFEIDPTTGVVTTKRKLDRELVDVHYFRVKAVDKAASPPRSATTRLQINVDDANDHEPVFEKEEYDTSVRESTNVGSTVLTVRATDEDTGPNADLRYTILNPSGANEAFRIEPKSGELSTRLMLDREEHSHYTLTIQAEDQGPAQHRLTATTQIAVTILDENDNYPQFTERTYTVEVPEDINAATSPVIAHIQANDHDSGKNGQVRYAITARNTAGHFTIDGMTGEVRVASHLDHETNSQYSLVIRAQDNGSPPRSNTTQLLVNVRDVNDNVPRFFMPLFQKTVQENVPVGYSIVRVQAFDNDAGDNSLLSYNIEGGGENLPVEVEDSTGWILTRREIDREENHHYTFTVVVRDHGDPPQSASATVILQIQDQNDNDPIFDPLNYEVSVSEREYPGTPVITVTATDKDENPQLHYAITSGNERGRFSITLQNGRGLVSLAQPLDFKQERRYILTVTATDAGGRYDVATIYVNVSDANTFPPQFENTPYSATVFEDAPEGSTVVMVAASDGDTGENARITYTLSGESFPEFVIHPSTGAITTTKPLDRETQGSYLLTVNARDNGTPQLSDTTDVEITVVDVNDNAPVFSAPSYRASVPEDATSGTSIIQIKASDADRGPNGRVEYSFENGNDGNGAFSVDGTSGVVRTARTLDRETEDQYSLVVLAVDDGPSKRSSSVTVMVDIEDVNDNPPMFETDRIQLYITENSPVGTTVGEVRAKDPDTGPNARIQYSIVGGPDAENFSMVAHPSEDRAELVTRVDLDYESPKKKYQLNVRAMSEHLRSEIPVTIHVVDVNDNAPVLSDFRIIFNNFKNHFPVGPIGRVPAMDADVTDQLKYRIINGNKAELLEIHPESG
ncbi:protocadherin-like wing polarity protein stan, partial [Homarus americanus]|uniref:protocadherin-like wing polarity protein stan n=1 Tax=Homarus americanus TaxID=6706 RepID=UPI001C44411E